MSAPLLVFVGGGTGAVLRWAVAQALPSPWATLAVNVLGSLAIGVLAHTVLALGSETRLLLVTGLLGGFTTYSAFNQELVARLAEGRTAEALGWAALMGASCLAGGALGHLLAGRLL